MIQRRATASGFTLLELSIVIVIISLIAGTGIKMAAGALKAADRTTTQERLHAIKAAVDSFAKTYGYLPCPADRTLRPSDTYFGIDYRNPTWTTCMLSSPGIIIDGTSSVYTGMVPLRTLGLPDNYAADAWGGKFDYIVSVNLTQNASSIKNAVSNIVVRYGDRTNAYSQTMARVATNFTSVGNDGGLAQLASTAGYANGTIIQVNGTVYQGTYTVSNTSGTSFDLLGSTYTSTDTGTTAILTPGANASYVVVSHGPDGRGAFPLQASTIPSSKLCNNSATANSSPLPCTSSSSTQCIDIENCNNDIYFYDTAFNDGTQASLYFDDYIVWGSYALQGMPFVTLPYTICPTGVCENWCAACATNYPGGGATVPTTILTNPFLYKKVINTNSTTCTAVCFWGGTQVAVPYAYTRAP